MIAEPLMMIYDFCGRSNTRTDMAEVTLTNAGWSDLPTKETIVGYGKTREAADENVGLVEFS